MNSKEMIQLFSPPLEEIGRDALPIGNLSDILGDLGRTELDLGHCGSGTGSGSGSGSGTGSGSGSGGLG